MRKRVLSARGAPTATADATTAGLSLLLAPAEAVPAASPSAHTITVEAAKTRTTASRGPR